MLVLQRGIEEIIDIGDSIEVHILGILGGKVRVGIVAPADVMVNRREITLAIGRQENDECRTQGR